jgi:hypothetical protein
VCEYKNSTNLEKAVKVVLLFNAVPAERPRVRDARKAMFIEEMTYVFEVKKMAVSDEDWRQRIEEQRKK